MFIELTTKFEKIFINVNTICFLKESNQRNKTVIWYVRNDSPRTHDYSPSIVEESYEEVKQLIKEAIK